MMRSSVAGLARDAGRLAELVSKQSAPRTVRRGCSPAISSSVNSSTQRAVSRPSVRRDVVSLSSSVGQQSYNAVRWLSSTSVVQSEQQSDSPSSTNSSSEWNVAIVPHRGVIEVSGKDTIKLFQGLVSNNVQRLEKGDDTMLFVAFMNPQGRMLADAFIHRLDPSKDDGSPHWLIDTDSRTLPSLLSFIKKFKLRSKVKLVDASDKYRVVQAFGASSDQATSPPVEVDGLAGALSLDPRAPNMGFRGIVSAESDLGTQRVESDEYTIHRIINGVAEGAHDFPEGSSLPLENNIDYMNGVDFRKGCYVGQELTARTHHTGVVRKRLIPLSLYEPGKPAPTSLSVDPGVDFAVPAPMTEVRSKPIASASATNKTAEGDEGAKKKPTRGKAAGKFTGGIHNIGLGCLRLEQVLRWQDSSSPAETGAPEDGLEMSIESADGRTLLVRPWISKWWPEQPKRSSDGDSE